MASQDQKGEMSKLPIYPWSLRFKPHPKVKKIMKVANLGGYADFRLPLALIPPGTPLFYVYARDRPLMLGGIEKKIATIMIASEITPSKWGDECMYFRHEKYDADLRMRPEWKIFVPK